MPHNRATIYSNGIADFQRIYPLVRDEPNKISIPVRQQHLADVLASLTVSGNVKIDVPPSFQPANLDDGNVEISSVNSLTELAAQLAGAAVEITIAKQIFNGKLVGVQDRQVGGAGESVTEQNLVILSDQGLQQFSLQQIENIYFQDATIRSEIEKSLNRRLREIKPNSTFIELELSAKGKAKEAIIQYTIPAAAWKISYRMIINNDADIDLHGHAIVDNNTDEDWKDFLIAVVMGQPITFSTDLAESKIPQRGHVNVVQESAVGSVEVEEAIALSAAPMGGELPADVAMVRQARPQMMKRSAGSRSRTAAAEITKAKVIETGADCGLAFDGDSDRAGFIDEHGHHIAADKLLAVLARDLLGRQPGASIVFDVKASQASGLPYSTTSSLAPPTEAWT